MQKDHKAREELSKVIENLKNEAEKLRLKDEDINNKLRAELEHTQFERIELESQGGEKDVKIKTLMKTNLEL